MSTTEVKATHTPGPWRITGAAEGAGITIESKRNMLLAFVRDNQHPLTDVTEHEATANAHLIAAAPDMLEALEGLLAHRECPVNSPEAEIARAAIKKAKG